MTFRARNKSVRAQGSFQAAVMEACEERRMLSHSHSPATASIVGGVLTVMGTRWSDDILVTVNADDSGQLDVINRGTLVGTFPMAGLTGISIDGRQGSDRLSVLNTLTIPVTLTGAQGKDTLNGAAGNDVLDGGEGKDALSGGLGDDHLSGGRGNDLLNGGGGNDVLSGGKGRDNLMGAADNDTLAGGAENDTVRGGDGDDQVEGGTGDDDLDGGNGTDDIVGEDGHDTFHSHDHSSERRDKRSDDLLKNDDDGSVL